MKLHAEIWLQIGVEPMKKSPSCEPGGGPLDQSMPLNRWSLLLFAASVLACTGPERSNLAIATIDTLPGGAIRVSNPGPTEWSDTTGWRLVSDLTITGADSEPGQLNDPSTLAVDRQGRVYVSDKTIKLFDSDGRFIRTVGRNGEGPGEYHGAMLTVAGDDLVVQDAGLGRLTLFDSAGRYLRSWHTDCCHIRPPALDASGQVVVWVSNADPADQSETYARYGLDGTPRQPIILAPAPDTKLWFVKSGFGGFSNAIPFSPIREVGFPPAGGIVYGWPQEYAIVWSRTGRDTAMIFGRAWTPTPISLERRNGAINYIKSFYARNKENFGGFDPAELNRVMNVADVPVTAPAFAGLEVDPAANFWVKVDPGEDSLRTHFDVFTSRGVYRGLVVAPAVLKGYGRTVWTSTAVYSIQETAGGLPVVVRYRIERP